MNRLLLLALVSLPSLALAETPLGHAHQFVFSNDFGASAGYSWVPGTSSVTRWSLSPSADFFLADHLSAGLGFAIRGEKRSDGSPVHTNYGARVRLGWLQPLGDALGVWPRLSLGVSTDSGGNGSPAATTIDTGVEVPFVVAPLEHLLFGVGPSFRLDLANWRDGAHIDGNVRGFGLGVFVGGWF